MAFSTVNDIMFRFRSDPKSLEQGTGKVRRSMSKTTTASNTLMKAMGALGLVFGARQIVDFGKSSIRAASDYQESVNAIEVATGDAAAEIQRFGVSAASGIGMSMTAVNDAGVSFAGFAENINSSDVAGTFEQYITRAADFASVMNLEASRSLDIFQSALAGQSKPIRTFGIDLSAAAVAVHATAKGIGEIGRELTEGEKQQARFSLLMQETAEFAGDFTNTADDLANSQRILTAEWENAQVALGKGLLPVMEAAVPVVIDLVQGIADMPNDLAMAGLEWRRMGSNVTGFMDDATLGVFKMRQEFTDLDKAELETRKQNDRLTDSFAEGATVMEAAETEINRLLLGFNEMSEESLRSLQSSLGLTNKEMLDLISSTEDNINAAFGLEEGYQAAESAVLFLQQALDNDLTKALEDDAEAARDLAWETLQLAKAEDAALKSAKFLTEEQYRQLDIFALLRRKGSEALQRLRNEWNSSTGRVRAYRQAVKDAAAMMDILARKVPRSGFRTSGGIIGLASGGPVKAGDPYVVGEEGPELMVPNQSGTIIPNGATTGGKGGPVGGGSNVYNIIVTAIDPDSAAIAVVDAIRSYEDRFGAV
jgi:hypothetical protein